MKKFTKEGCLDCANAICDECDSRNFERKPLHKQRALPFDEDAGFENAAAELTARLKSNEFMVASTIRSIAGTEEGHVLLVKLFRAADKGAADYDGDQVDELVEDFTVLVNSDLRQHAEATLRIKRIAGRLKL